MLNKREVIIRTITGAGIVALTLAAILISQWTFLIWLSLICYQGGREYLKLSGTRNPTTDFIVCIAGSLLLLLTGYLWQKGNADFFLLRVFLIAFTSIMLLIIVTQRMKHGSALAPYIHVLLYPFIMLTAGVVFTGPNYTITYILLPIILLWVNDIFAYLIGSTWGKNKIAPDISPGKSWEGTLGAGLLTVCVSLGSHFVWPGVPFLYALLSGLLIPYVGLLGDLFESRLKRRAGVKDSGNLLPGHGGVLDRYDSFIFVLPVAAILYFIFVI